MSVKTEFDTIKKPLADYAESLVFMKGDLKSRGELDDIRALLFEVSEREVKAALDSIRVLELAFAIARQP